MVRSTLALAAVLPVASISLAGDLVTPAVFVGASTNAECRLTNITSASIPAQLQLIKAGVVVDDSGSITVPAGLTAAIAAGGTNSFVTCRFLKASKSKVRASLGTFVATDDGTDHVVVATQ
jgi:hypothetical protein